MSENEAVSVKNAANDDINRSLGDVGEVEGRRRTRSAARGIPATPPPAKKERKSSTAGGKGRGRGRPKKAKDQETDETDSQDEGREPAEADPGKPIAEDDRASADPDAVKPSDAGAKQAGPDSEDAEAGAKINNNSESGNGSGPKRGSVDGAEKASSENGENDRKTDADDGRGGEKDGPTSDRKGSDTNDAGAKRNSTSDDAESLKSTTDASEKPAE